MVQQQSTQGLAGVTTYPPKIERANTTSGVIKESVSRNLEGPWTYSTLLLGARRVSTRNNTAAVKSFNTSFVRDTKYEPFDYSFYMILRQLQHHKCYVQFLKVSIYLYHPIASCLAHSLRPQYRKIPSLFCTLVANQFSHLSK